MADLEDRPGITGEDVAARSAIDHVVPIADSGAIVPADQRVVAVIAAD